MSPAAAEIIVVKCGGHGGVDIPWLCADIARLRERGASVVLVHGGAAVTAELAARLGVELRQMAAVDGTTSRYTDAATLDALLLALAGRVKPCLLTQLNGHGVRAIGLTGIDAGLLRARRRRAVRAVVDGRISVVRDDLSGRITSVDAALLRDLLGTGLVPVLSPPALDEDGAPVNVNADRVAAEVAVALGARDLVFLTDVPGVLADPDDPASVLARYRVPAVGGPAAAVSAGGPGQPSVGGGMAVKLVAAARALAGGVPRVVISGGGQRPVSRVLDGAAGTSVQRA